MTDRTTQQDRTAQHRPGLEPAAPDWRDRLVELHVLAAHGDDDAARAAEAWIATDSRARSSWEAVQRECAQIRAASTGDVPG
ncbi:MAG: hypothetical protein L0I76_26110 [Pseudonocardia sp.]|nr:hypothetical protein [Pseudonocardia sp.]